MEVRCIGEALLKSTTSPLLSFLAPAVFPKCRPIPSATLSRYTSLRRQRFFSAQTQHKAEEPPPTRLSRKPRMPSKPSKPQANLSEIFDRSGDRQPPSIVPSATPGNTDMKPRINAKFDELFPRKNGPSTSSSPSSATDVENAYRDFLNPSGSGVRSGSIAGSMLMPSASDSSSTTQRQVNGNLLFGNERAAQRNKRTVRPRPTVGRTIEVEERMGVDFGQAVKKLSMLLVNNRVRQDQRMQKYHERAGAKRKRLKRERWRRYFKEGFNATIGRVKQMRRQGW